MTLIITCLLLARCLGAVSPSLAATGKGYHPRQDMCIWTYHKDARLPRRLGLKEK